MLRKHVTRTNRGKATHRKSLHSVPRFVLSDEGSILSGKPVDPRVCLCRRAMWTLAFDWVRACRSECVRSPRPAGVGADGGQCRTRTCGLLLVSSLPLKGPNDKE